MVRVKSFMGCCLLETGGMVLGWIFFASFLLITTLIFVFGLKTFSASPHPFYTLIWLDVIIFLIIVVYSSWLFVQGIKTVDFVKNPSKIQPFRLVFIASIVIFLGIFLYSVYAKYFKKRENIEENISREDIFDIIEQDFGTVLIFLWLLLFLMSCYFFIFVDSVHKSIKEIRQRMYVVAKL